MKNLIDPVAAPRAPKMRKRTRAFMAVAASLGVVIFVATIIHFSGDALLNRYVRPKLEQAFSARFPGSSLHLGELRFNCWSNCLSCDSVAMTGKDGAPTTARAVSARGVRWATLLAGKPEAAGIFRSAVLEVADVSALLPESEYRVHCEHLRISVPDSEISLQAFSVEAAVSDEAFFASTPFRRARCRVAVASCLLRGVDFAEFFKGQAYRAESLEVASPVFESLVSRDKPRRPAAEPPPMPHEMLAAIPKPFRIDRLTITDGLIKYAARRFEGAEPGVLTFTAVQISAQDLANAAAGGRAIGIVAEGKLMDAGTMTVQMRIPVAASTLTFQYSGKLSAMDLTRLDEYMEGSGRIQIKSGSASEALFDIDVADGHARGTLRGAYRDLQVTVVDRETGSGKGVTNRVATILANHFVVKSDNTPDKAGGLKAGKVDYIRKPEETFLQFAWLALRSGVLDLVSLQASPIPSGQP